MADQAAALYRASQYIDIRYRHRLGTGRWACMFSGERVAGRTQDQEWPRVNATDYYGNAVDSTTIPLEVQNATIEAALREGTNPGSLLPDFDPSLNRLPTEEKVGNLSIKYSEAFTRMGKLWTEGPSDFPNTTPVFPEIDAIIAPLLTGPGASALGTYIAMNVIR